MDDVFVFSPSNMMAYRQCPLKFYGQYMAKDIKWESSPQKLRGTECHKVVEAALMNGIDDARLLDYGMDTHYVRRKVEEFRALPGDKYVEREMVVTRGLGQTTWWADDAFIRTRADALCVQPERVLLVDIKTGKHWDDVDFQLRVEAMLAAMIWNRRIDYEYWYVDAGDTVAGSLSDWSDIMETLCDMILSMRNGHYPRKQSRFCRWCAYHQTPKCKP